MRQTPMITAFRGKKPKLGKNVWIDPSARLIGDIEIRDCVNIWPGAVLRGDDDTIFIDCRSSILDLSLIESPKSNPVIIEKDVLISHKVCLHGATVKTGALVGIGSIVLDSSVIGEEAVVGAGSIVTPGTKIPPKTLALGQPAKPIRELTLKEIKTTQLQLERLSQKAAEYLQSSS